MSGSSAGDGDGVAKNKNRVGSLHQPEKKRRRKADANLKVANEDGAHHSNTTYEVEYSNDGRECQQRIAASSQLEQAAALGHLNSELFQDPQRYQASLDSFQRQRQCFFPQQNLAALVAGLELTDFSRLAQTPRIMPFPSDLAIMPLVGDRSCFGSSVGVESLYLPHSPSLAQVVRDAIQRTYQMQSFPLDHMQRIEWTRQYVAGNNSNQIVESARRLELAKRLGELTQPGVRHSESALPLDLVADARQINHQRTNNVGDTLLPHQAHEPKTQRSVLLLAIPQDHGRLNEQQIFLRQQIEVFRATEDDIMSHTRGRNKAVSLLQVGLRCRHCGHLPVGQRRKASTYFPSTLMSMYQAAQNLNMEHFQSGICQDIPAEIQNHFQKFGEQRAGISSAGKPYWAEAGRQLGLVDTEEGIRFASDLVATIWPPYPGFGINR